MSIILIVVCEGFVGFVWFVFVVLDLIKDNKAKGLTESTAADDGSRKAKVLDWAPTQVIYYYQ